MATIPLKPQYGPTLGTLLAPRWHAAPRGVRGLVRGACVGIVVLAVAVVLTLLPATYSHGGPAPFSFSYRGLYRTTPEAGQYVRVDRRGDGRLEDSFAVSPLRLPPYEGGLSGELPVYASGYIDRLRAKFGGFVLRGEGKTRVNTVPAYNIFYTATVEGREMYGRDVLLLPEREGARDGVALEMLTLPEPLTSPLEVASAGVLERPVETFSIS
ncbi:MAG TPA: hypothetical protein VGL54_03680 [Solirubrobacteraceae bacterium]|jgi:hypothetical protein